MSGEIRTSRSVKFTLHEFRSVMETYGVTNPYSFGQEYAFALPLSAPEDYAGDPIIIEILSSVSTWNGWSRDRDKDAIRLSLKYRGKTLAQRKVYRTEGWQQRLEGKISELQNLIAPHLLCPSGHRLLLRRNRDTGDVFWGCVDYPNCHRTRPFY